MGKKRTAKKQDARGVKNVAEAAEWLEARGLEDIECIVPDMSGVARGKIYARRQVRRCAGHVDARLDLPADHHRRLSGRG